MNLQKQLRCVYLHAFTSTLRFTDAVWVALLAARGFTLAQIGLAEGVFHGVSLLCEVPSGMAADLLGRRRTLIFGGALGVVSAATMAFAPSLAFICAGMGLKALGYNLLSGTTEALTYDSLKAAGRERDYIKVDAKASIFMKLASALGALASLLAGVLTSAGYYLADAAVSAVSALAAANLTEPVVTDEQAAREKHILQELPARLRVHILDSLDCLCSSTPARRIIMADAVISLPSYLTSMFVQQRLTQQGWAMEWLFLPGLLAGAAGMAHRWAAACTPNGCARSISAVRCSSAQARFWRAQPRRCSAPLGRYSCRGHSPSGSCTVCSGSTTRSPVTAAQRSSAWTAWPTVC